MTDPCFDYIDVNDETHNDDSKNHNERNSNLGEEAYGNNFFLVSS